ncbi:PRA1 family protein [Tripterygium wilfordii]|uniref:PRA1 family protein n=1 Tax=Tripterygium wilfordii TaxID=458696 RepID=A0A7J7DHE9_TRIWF|nr:PRA1 family protein F3-like [Tripterygium wilfordii]KAF5745486.1 PRA1 family protein [Tripterygium wilfordii]
MTNYGAIPTSSAPSGPSSSTLEYISRAKERIKAGLGTRQPWKIMLHIHSLKLPSNFAEAITRLKINIPYFRVNYAIIVLLILFLSLLWHPISLIVFIIMMAAWVFLYFFRDEPLVLFSHTIDDRVVLIFLSVLTLVLLLLTDATLNILVSLLIGVVIVVVHAEIRKTEDLFLDEEAAGLMTTSSGGGVGGAAAAALS